MKEQRSYKEYFEYTKDMNVKEKMAIIPDDKTKHAHWVMLVEMYEAVLVTYCCASEHWSFSSMSQREAAECMEVIMNENLAKRWHREFGLSSARTQNWLQYSYFTIKSNCYKETGRVCQKIGNSCVRKIVAYAKWPKGEAWRRAGRCIKRLVRDFGNGLGSVATQHSP